MPRKELTKYLAAFADGELDVADNLRLLDLMKMDPNASARVTHQQQLRERVSQVMGNTPAMPQSIRDELVRMIDRAPVPDRHTQSRNRRFAGWLGVAAMLVVSVTLAVAIHSHWNPPPSAPSPYLATSLISEGQANLMSKRHVSCCQMPQKLNAFAEGAVSIEKMPAIIQEKLGGQVYPTLDLSGIGYQFVKAGPCTLPGDQAAHMIYQAMPQTGRHDAISLWITYDTGTLDIHPDVIYRIRGPEYAHPIIVWRHQGMIYYLVGDSYPGIKQAYFQLTASH